MLHALVSSADPPRGSDANTAAAAAAAATAAATAYALGASLRAAFCSYGSGILSHLTPAFEKSPRVRGGGWAYVVERGDKPGLVSWRAGSELELRVDVSETPVAQALLHLVYLSSYEHMGTGRLRCARGCACHELLMDATEYTRNVSLHRQAVVQVNFTRQPCLLHLFTAPSARGSKFKVTGLILSTHEQQHIFEHSSYLAPTTPQENRTAASAVAALHSSYPANLRPITGFDLESDAARVSLNRHRNFSRGEG